MRWQSKESSSRWPGTEKVNTGLGIKGIETMKTVTICGSMRFEKEMPLEELWKLFPIFLVEPDEKWELFYADIESRLHQILADCRVERISHIGSTAIPGIWAKDIVDILIEISETADIEDAARIIENIGFIRMSTGKRRISFNLGYTKDGFADRVFHVHLRYAGDNDELYFRDYLVDHPQTAKEYERLKLGLWKKFEHNRDAYTDAKTEFIRKWTDVAKSVYLGRY